LWVRKRNKGEEILECKVIETRKSVRMFDRNNKLELEQIQMILKAASMAPSGKNLQPWKFQIFTDDEVITKIAKECPNNRWMNSSPCIISVYLDLNISYDFTKDAMAIGAAIENMLLEAEAEGISSCWIGECTEHRENLEQIFGVDNQLRLMAFVVLGYEKKMKKKSISEIVINLEKEINITY